MALVNADEKRGYSKGYNAGNKRRAREIKHLHQLVKSSNETKRERIFCAALNGLLAGNGSWTVGEEAVKNVDTYVNLAIRFTGKAMRKL